MSLWRSLQAMDKCEGGTHVRQGCPSGKENRINMTGMESRSAEAPQLFPAGFCVTTAMSPEVLMGTAHVPVTRYTHAEGHGGGCSIDSDSDMESVDTDGALDWLSDQEAEAESSADDRTDDFTLSRTLDTIVDRKEKEYVPSPPSDSQLMRPLAPPATATSTSRTGPDSNGVTKARRGKVLQRLSEYEAARSAEAAMDPSVRRAAPRRKPVSQKMKELINITAEALSRPQTVEPCYFAETLDQLCDPHGPAELSLAGFQGFQKQDAAKKEESFKKLAQAVGSSTSLTSLNLSATMANDDLAEELARCLVGNSSLAKLNLETNDLTGRGLLALAQLVHSGESKGLQELRLVNQLRICPSAVQHKMAAAVKANSNIVVCSMDCRDATAREALERALTSNIDARRIARLIRKTGSSAEQEGQDG